MVVVLPLHITAEPGVAVTVGVALTVMVLVAVLVQPDALVPLTVYVVVARGAAVSGVPVEALRPDAGDQEYVTPPPALTVVDAPRQIDVAPPPAVIAGKALTVIVLVAVLVQPAALVPVTVYVVVVAGVAVTGVPVVALKSVAGDQA